MNIIQIIDVIIMLEQVIDEQVVIDIIQKNQIMMLLMV
jgi:hypothetical protein